MMATVHRGARTDKAGLGGGVGGDAEAGLYGHEAGDIDDAALGGRQRACSGQDEAGRGVEPFGRTLAYLHTSMGARRKKTVTVPTTKRLSSSLFDGSRRLVSRFPLSDLGLLCEVFFAVYTVLYQCNVMLYLYQFKV